MLPLYQATNNHQDVGQLAKQPSANAGLVFNRFFNWNVQGVDDLSINNPRQKEDFLKLFNRKQGGQANLDRFVARQMLLNKSLKAHSMVMRADWHWVTGLGLSHPLENGFCWHHNLSLPYLPGSSVKGLLRAFCEMEQMPQEQLTQWFGSNTVSAAELTAGELVFFDAIPIEPAFVIPDVMTPHSGDWLESGDTGKTAPADWHTPVPVPFLVCKNLKLLFSVALAPHSQLDSSIIEQVMQKLADALGFLGAGAKTAVGYGTMSKDKAGDKYVGTLFDALDSAIKQQQQQAERAAALASMTPNQQAIVTLLEQLNSESLINQAIQALKELANGPIDNWTGDERRELAQKLRNHKFSQINNKDKAKARKELIKRLDLPL